jgi:CP family cyanate transporter-like MFS transporter
LTAPLPRTAWLVLLGGVAAALHVGKLPPALPVLRDALGISLVEAGFLLSLVQLAGMTLGLPVGLAADSIGPRRTMVAGLVLTGVASIAGGWVSTPGPLLALRALEGLGFLLGALPAPALIRGLVPPERLSAMLGLWSTFMPVATSLALLCGPAWIAWAGWPAWWWLLGAFSLLMAAWLAVVLPKDPQGAHLVDVGTRVRQTLGAPGPWLVALAFGAYSSQWLAVIGFLPSIYRDAGMAPSWAVVATTLAAAVNIIGNVASGRLLQRGVRAPRLLAVGFLAMGVGGVLAFAPLTGDGATGALLRYVGVLVLSGIGGVIPGTLFALAVRLAPGERTVSTTIGWMQQWSAFGQFAGPPLVAWVASRSGGWQWSWIVTTGCAMAGLALAAWAARLPQLRGH